MHARIQGDLSHILQKRYKAKILYTLEDWMGGEAFDYLEIEIY